MGKATKKLIPFAGLLLLIVVFALTTQGRFLNSRNIMILISQAAITMIGATGTVFVMAHGNLDFSLGGGCALCAVFSYVITGGRNVVLMFVVCVLLGVVCGLITSTIHIKGHIPAFMAGMCIMFAGRGFAEALIGRTGMYLTNVSHLATAPFYLLVLAVVFVVAFVLFNYTKIGKYQKLIGSNPNAAQLSGIPVARYKLYAFIISGVTLGIASFLMMIRLGGVAVTTGTNLETDVLISLSLGGLAMTGGSSSKIRSAIVGTMTYFILSNGLTLWGVDGNMVFIVKAIVFLLTVFISSDYSRSKVPT